MEKRKRMMLDLPPEVQMAIRIRAIKNGCTTGQLVEDIVRQMYPDDVEDAHRTLTGKGKQR